MSIVTQSPLQDERLFLIEKTLQSISYKPGWKFCVKHSHFDNIFIFSAKYTTPDSSDQANQISVESTFRVCGEEFAYANNLEGLVFQMIFSLIKKAEEHETNEWLRVNGERVYEPHPELKGVGKLKSQNGKAYDS